MIVRCSVVFLVALVQVGAQRGHFIRPPVEYQYPTYRVPVNYEETYQPRQVYTNARPVKGRTAEETPEITVKQTEYPILSYMNQMDQDGGYSYRFETADGVRREETSVMKTLGDGSTAQSVRGSYSYPSADGRMIRVEYIADEGGYRATQVHEGDESNGPTSPIGGSTYRRIGDRGYMYSYRAPFEVSK